MKLECMHVWMNLRAFDEPEGNAYQISELKTNLASEGLKFCSEWGGGGGGLTSAGGRGDIPLCINPWYVGQ